MKVYEFVDAFPKLFTQVIGKDISLLREENDCEKQLKQLYGVRVNSFQG